MSITKNLIAPCGMNCAICAGYLRKNNKCPGCLNKNKNKPASCVYCVIKKCPKRLRNGWEYCHKCDSVPCDRLERLDKRYRTHYHMSMLANLKFIKSKGMRAFLADQRKQWACRKCGGTVCCHNGLCYSCQLDKLEAKKRKYQWDE
ncbi:MAG: DUF3795 domain-containing protein [Patescibacteria group bacterium]